MQARLKSSTKWTQLPEDVTRQIHDLFQQNFQKELGKSQVLVEGRIYKEEILLRVGFLEPGRLAQMNFEVSMDYKLTAEDSAINTLGTCVDAVGSLMAEYFESQGEIELPLSWAEYPFEGKKVWLQHSTTNTSLEKQAQQLLGEDPEALVQGEDEQALIDNEDLVDEEDSDTEDDDDDGDGDGPRGPLH